MFKYFPYFPLLLLLVLTGNTFAKISDFIPEDYLKQNPYFTVECVTSRYTPVGGNPATYGVPAGHSVAYLHGLCKKDRHSIKEGETPHQIELCKDKFRQEGVGISTDGVNYDLVFLLSPSFDVLVYGTQDKELQKQALTAEVEAKIVEERRLAGDYQDVGLITAWFSPQIKKDYIHYQQILHSQHSSEQEKIKAQEGLETLIGHWTFGTDNAFAQARYAYCYVESKTPTQMQKMATKLNSMNQQVWSKARRLEREGLVNVAGENKQSLFYTPIANNCASSVGRLTGYLDGDATPVSDFRAILHTRFDIPGFSLLAYYQRSEDLFAMSAEEIFKNQGLRNDLLQEEWSPHTANSSFLIIPFHREGNQLFADTWNSKVNKPFFTVGAAATLMSQYISERRFKMLKNIAGYSYVFFAILKMDQYRENLKDAKTLDEFIMSVDSQGQKLVQKMADPAYNFHHQHYSALRMAKKYRLYLQTMKDEKIARKMKEDADFAHFIHQYRRALGYKIENRIENKLEIKVDR